MRKMVQPHHWVVQLVLLCQLWQLGFTSLGWAEYSCVGIYQEASFISEEDIGDIVLFCVIVIIGQIGKKLDKGYRCPVYCEVDHTHIHETEEDNIQADDDVPGSGTPEDGEQSEDVLRTCSDVHGLRGNERALR